MIRKTWRVQFDGKTVGLFRHYEEANALFEHAHDRGAKTWQLHQRVSHGWREWGTGWAAGAIDARGLAAMGIPINDEVLSENPRL